VIGSKSLHPFEARWTDGFSNGPRHFGQMIANTLSRGLIVRFSFCLTAGILTGSVCFAQSVSIGLIGGGMVSNDLGNPWLSSVSPRYAIGPQVDIGLPLGFGVEVDALYRHEGYNLPQFPAYSELYATSWEFPLLLKKSLPFPVVKPFVEAGYAPRRLEGTSYYTSATTSQGLVIGGGVQVGIGRLRLEPAVRYTHWNNSPALLVIADGPSPQLSSNQVDLLLGISWKLR
jgi:hypothetical protein